MEKKEEEEERLSLKSTEGDSGPCCNVSCWCPRRSGLDQGNAVSSKEEGFQLFLQAIPSYLHQPLDP